VTEQTTSSGTVTFKPAKPSGAEFPRGDGTVPITSATYGTPPKVPANVTSLMGVTHSTACDDQRVVDLVASLL
jgi:hypothetical protein